MNPWVERLGWVLVHSLWQFALVALLASGMVRALRRSASATRYGVLVVAMAVSVIAPVATWKLLPRDALSDDSASQGASANGHELNASANPGADAARLASGPVVEGFDPKVSDDPVSAANVGWDSVPTGVGLNTAVGTESQPTRIAWSERITTRLRPWLSWIVAAWSLGVVVCSLRPWLGWHTLRRLKRVGVSPVSGDVLAAMRRVSERLSLRRAVRVLQSTLAQVPVVVGYLRPVVLLPVSLMTSLPAEQLEAILAHELAHVRRHDFLVNLLQTLIETLFFYHPAVWWLSHQIRVEREHCCDDLVVSSFGNRVEYGRALLAIAELRGQSTVLALGAADGSLLSRVRRIVGLVPEQTAVRLSDRWPIALVTLACLLTLALGTFVSSRAEMEPPFVERDDRAGRGSPDPALAPTAGLPNSDEETHPPNNTNGDLRSNPAAGSGDPRRAQDNSGRQAELRTLRKPALLLPDHWIVQAVGFDHDGKELVTASNQSFITIRRWDVVGRKLISEIKLQGDKHGRAVRDGTLIFSGDRRRVVAATDEYVGIWDATTGKLLKQLPFKTKEGIYTCAIDMLDGTPDLSVIVGHRALPGRLTLSFDAHVFVWDGLSGNVLQTVIDKGATDLKAMDLSSDGKRLVTTNGSGANIWETSTGKLLRSIPNDNTGSSHVRQNVGISPNSPRSGERGYDHVWSVQFSPDGQQIAMGDILGVKLLDATSGKLLQQLEGPYRYSSSGGPGLVFSKDGQWLARLGTQEQAEGDKHRYVVPIWSTRTGARLFELHTEANDAAFSDDGQRLAVVFSDMQQALSVWTLSGDAEKGGARFHRAEHVENVLHGPGPHSRQDRVEENGHYVGKTAAEFIDKFQPTWGETKLGLQYGIALTKPQPQVRSRDGVPTYERGDRISLVVFFRNASDKPIKFDTAPDFFGNTPKVLNAKGEPIVLENIPLLGHIPHYHEQLAPGEALGPFYLSFGLGENPRPGQQHWHPYSKTPIAGNYKLTHSASINVSGPKDGEAPKRDDITTGTIEFEIINNGNPAPISQSPAEQ